MSRNPLTPKGANRTYRGGRREDIGIFVRSSWEANWARYLNWLKALGQITDWQYEVDTFEFPIKRGVRFYTPDFKVFSADGTYVYHEVKGYMDPKSITRAKRMAKYYPNERVIMIDQSEYMAVRKKIGPMIDGWER